MEVSQSSRHSERVEQVNEKVENIGVILRAMWSLLEETGLSADQLMDRIEEIEKQRHEEANDGVPNATKCRSCDSMVAFGLPSCQYCGARMEGHHELNPIDRL